MIAEGEVLEIQNTALKEELRKLEAEARSLTDLLSQHSKVCVQKRKLVTERSELRGLQDPPKKQRKVDDPRGDLDVPERSNKTDYENNMEAFQTNYYHGLNLDNPGVSIKSEDPGNSFYEARGYFGEIALLRELDSSADCWSSGSSVGSVRELSEGVGGLTRTL